MTEYMGEKSGRSGNLPSDEERLMKQNRVTGILPMAAIIFLIIAIILISFDKRLPAGCFVIAAAALILVNLKKTKQLLISEDEPVTEKIAAHDERDKDVITDFSHRLREPLNTLVFIGDMLMEAHLQKKHKELVETLVASANNMATTVNELSIQSAGSLSGDQGREIRFNILSAVQNTIELYGQKEKANLDFILNRKEHHEFECSGDPVVLKQILLDIFNSIEEKSTDRITRVTISLRNGKEPGQVRPVRIRIQTDRNIMMINEGGTGGLLASKLIKKNNGSFTQEPGENVSVLTITLPLKYPGQGIKKDIHVTDVNKPDPSKKRKELKDVNLLLVEDNIINQRIILLSLKPLVRSIETASNGREALEKLATGHFDLVLMDIMMPVMNGLDAAENIREIEEGTGNHIPIIAITANAMPGDRERCISSGIDDYISKPFQPAALIGKILDLI